MRLGKLLSVGEAAEHTPVPEPEVAAPVAEAPVPDSRVQDPAPAAR